MIFVFTMLNHDILPLANGMNLYNVQPCVRGLLEDVSASTESVVCVQPR